MCTVVMYKYNVYHCSPADHEYLYKSFSLDKDIFITLAPQQSSMTDRGGPGLLRSSGVNVEM